jgi:primosomal protein N''
VLLGREFGWTLDEMRQLYPSELKAILKELQKQKLVEEYAEQKSKWAFLAAVIANCTAALSRVLSGKKKKPKLVEPDDFISKDFKRIVESGIYESTSQKTDFEKNIQDAKNKGLSGPW